MGFGLVDIIGDNGGSMPNAGLVDGFKLNARCGANGALGGAVSGLVAALCGGIYRDDEGN